MAHLLCPGMIVKHFKREMLSEDYLNKHPTSCLYKIIDLNTRNSENLEDQLVLYQSLYDSPDGKIHQSDYFTRPYEMFMSKVDKEKYPQIKQEYRFELI